MSAAPPLRLRSETSREVQQRSSLGLRLSTTLDGEEERPAQGDERQAADQPIQGFHEARHLLSIWTSEGRDSS